jgi:protein-disulfide isomerase
VTSFERLLLAAIFLLVVCSTVTVGLLIRERRQLDAVLAILRRQEITARPGSIGRAENPRTATVSLAGAATLGSETAPLTMVYFTDYACSYCGRFARETLPRLRRNWITPGHLRLVVRDFPLRASSVSAGVAARCAGRQDAYWRYHDALFERPVPLDGSALMHAAGVAGVNLPLWRKCLSDSAISERVRRDREEAVAAGLNGTPSFVVGLSGRGSSISGSVLVGALPTDIFERTLEQRRLTAGNSSQ